MGAGPGAPHGGHAIALELFLILMLILLNGALAMSEASLMQARRARLETRASRGRGARGALKALQLIDNPTRFLSTSQVGITLIGIGAGAIGEKSISDRLEPVIREWPLVGPYSAVLASVVMVVLLTYVSLILGELVPKRLAMEAPEAIASAVARPMSALGVFARPLVALLTVSTDVIIRMIPGTTKKSAVDEQAAEAEVRAILASGAQEGVFHESEQKIVDRVFRLSDQTAKSLMVPRTDIDWLRSDDPVARIRVAVATSTHSHFPVCRGSGGLDELIGVVHVKDLVKAGLISDDVTLEQLATPPLFVPENTPALELLDLFRESHQHIAFVADEHGTLEGLVTLNDVTSAIIGEVSRGGPPEDPMIVERAPGSYLLDGLLPVADLRALLKLHPDQSLPKEDEGYETLGGMMMTALGRIPAAGDVYEWDTGPQATGGRGEGDAGEAARGAESESDGSSGGEGSRRPRFRFEVVDMDRTRVDKVMLTVAPEPGDAARGDGPEEDLHGEEEAEG